MLIGGLLVALGMGVAQAQNPALTPGQVTITAACKGNQNVSLASQATYCFGTDGAFVSLNGAAPIQFAPPGAATAVSLTLNGVTKTLPASFTVSAAAPAVAAPTISASSSAPSASAPAITAQ